MKAIAGKGIQNLLDSIEKADRMIEFLQVPYPDLQRMWDVGHTQFFQRFFSRYAQGKRQVFTCHVFSV